MIPQLVIDVAGWLYFLCWSLGFYGQLYESWRLKSAEGLNLNFLAMNLTGYTFYSLYCAYGYFSPDSTTPSTGRVDLNDLLVNLHCLFVSILITLQAFKYPLGRNRLGVWAVCELVAMWVFMMIYSTLSMPLKVLDPPPRLSAVSFLGYFKLAIAFTKCLPQAYWNWKRKSTVGWSIANVLLDCAGGLFSFLQMALEALDGRQVDVNGVKLALAILSMGYDAIFIFQHYCLYRPKPSSVQETPAASEPTLREDPE